MTAATDRLDRHGRAGLLAAFGCAALVLGLVVYLTDRDLSRSALIPVDVSLAGRHVFGALGSWLPSLVHTFAFGLFTAAALPPHSTARYLRYLACMAWFVVNVAFELGQHPQFSARLAELLQGELGWMPLTRPLAKYFVEGTFDQGDIVAALLGALSACAVLWFTDRR